MTHQQFIHNRITYDLQFSRVLPWLIGKENLRDMRCLRTDLSIPLNYSYSKFAEQTLEKTWLEWYQWWMPRFPKL